MGGSVCLWRVAQYCTKAAVVAATNALRRTGQQSELHRPSHFVLCCFESRQRTSALTPPLGIVILLVHKPVAIKAIECATNRCHAIALVHKRRPRPWRQGEPQRVSDGDAC